MQDKKIRMTTVQFARLHDINKRTLHYYDSINLFSPQYRDENNYRYYDATQSITFEYIRMLKELNMSIDEIKTYLDNQGSKDFIKIVEKKTEEIDKQIQRLKKTKKILQLKKEQAEFCEKLPEQDVHITECEEEKYLTTPFDFAENSLEDLFPYVKSVWGIEQCRMGIGSYISVDKIKNNHFEIYDGLFTPALKKDKNIDVFVKPKGKYLCGYQKGTWDKLPGLYEKMLKFAKECNFNLTGYAYEMGLNDFFIADKSDYITQIMIKIE